MSDDDAYERTLLGAFFLSSSLAIAGSAALDEATTGEPALRGFVHAGIGCLVALLLWTRPKLRVPRAFGVTALCIACGCAASRPDRVLLGVAFLVIAIEACRALRGVWAANVYFAVASARLGVVSQDPVPYVFHTAFVSSLDASHAEVALLHAVASLAMSMWCVAHRHDAAVGYTLAFLRSVYGARTLSAHFDQHEEYRPQTTRLPPFPRRYAFAVFMYGLALSIDAWSVAFPAERALPTLTRMLHVAAVVGALWNVVPSALRAFKRLRAPLLAFPVIDALLCVFRVARSEHRAQLMFRAGAAALVALALWTGVYASDATTYSPCKSYIRCIGALHAHRSAIALYTALHVLFALRQPDADSVVAVMFHYIVVISSFAWMGIEHGEATSLHMARTLVAFDATASVALCAAGVESTWMATKTLLATLVLCVSCTRASTLREDPSSLLYFPPEDIELDPRHDDVANEECTE